MKREEEKMMVVISTKKLIESIPNDDDSRRKLAHHTVEQWDLHQVFEYAVDILQEKYEENSNFFDEDLEFYCEDVMDYGVYGNEVSTVGEDYFGETIGPRQQDPAKLFPTSVFSIAPQEEG
jgi:hypothetical protein